jgi:hypothetical protein
VLRVREGSYYRIELPFTSEEEKERVEEFKTVLRSVLHYERTPSPFGRSYEETPARTKTPVRRQTQQLQPAKRWRLNKFWEPEDAAERAKWSPANSEHTISPGKEVTASKAAAETDFRAAESEDSPQEDYSTEDDTITEGSVESEKGDEDSVTPLDRAELSKPMILPFRLRPVQARSVTAPQHLILHTSPPSSSPVSRTSSRDTDTISIASSHDTFYSMDSAEESTTHSSGPETFQPLIQENDTIREQFASIKASTHKRQTSEITVIPDTPTPIRTTGPGLAPQPAEPSDPATPTLISDSDEDSDNPPWADAVTPPDTIRLRHLPRRLSNSSQATDTSALSRPVNLFSTPAAPSLGKLLTAALVQKAYAILISPPAHLVALMLEIASKIINGVPIMYGPNGRKQRIPCSWEDSEADGEDEWDEDDFGMPLDNLKRPSDVSMEGSDGGHSSGVD